MIDSVHAIETPEGVGLEICPVGPGPRMIAQLVDALIRAAVYFVVYFIGALLGTAALGLALIMLFLVEWFYPVLFEIFNHGQTPGKKVMGIKVVHEDGSPLSWRSSILRNFLRTVDILPFCYAFGLVSVLVTRQFQRIGDLLAGTLVVYQEKDLSAHHILPLATPKPPLEPLQLDEQRAVISFAERSSQLSEARSVELADIISIYTKSDDSKGVHLLHGNAAWLVGRRS